MDKHVIEALGEYLGLSFEDIDQKADLREDLGLGPIEFNDLVTFLSERFGVSFPTEEVANLKTVEDLQILVEDNLI